MKQYIFLIFISSLLLFSLTFGCSSSHSKKTHDHRDVSVEIREKLDEKGNVIKKSFNHPYYFTDAGLAYILSFVYYKEGITGKREKMVFREEELQNIIPPIISAFSMANDSQDILVFSSPHYDFWVNTRSYFSMFITNNELNIVFSTIKSKKSWRTDGRALQMSTYWRNSNKRIFKDPLYVKRSSRWRLVPMEGQRFAPGRPNWLIIDLSSNLFGMAGSDNVSDNISDNSIEAGSSVRAIERKVRTNENVIEDKLRKLKVQKDEGLISEEDYEKRKKELLGKF
ncbi:MAG: SHOCT domain-containing protein [Candidatus Scalindua sediminis]